MSSPSHDILDLSMAFAQCFVLCYVDIWLLELAVESYNVGIISRVPEAGFWTIIAAALGAGFCLLAYTIKKAAERKDKNPPLY